MTTEDIKVIDDCLPEGGTTDSKSFFPVMKGNTAYKVRETLIVNGNRNAQAFRQLGRLAAEVAT